MEIELNIPETEITGNDISVETGNTNIAVLEDTKDLDITYNRKEYSIIGDGIFISSVLEDVPEWLGNLIDSTFEAAILSRDQNLINRMEAILTALDYVPKNRYTEQINQIVDEDGIINTRIATLNSNLTDALTKANATIAEIDLTYASKDEASAIATNVITASLSADGEIGSTLINLQNAYADLESTTAESITLLESIMEGEINGNASAMETIRSYVGIDEAGASTGTGLSAYLEDSNGTIGGADSQLANTIRVTAEGVESKFAYNSIVNINGVYKKSGFGLTTNYISGAGTQANPYVSEFWIDASRLKFTNSNQTGQVAPFTIDATEVTPQITFNGKVSFSNVTNVPQLGSTPQEVVTAINNAQTTTINGPRITTGSITAAQIQVDSISADRLSSSNGSSTTWTGGGLVSQNFNGNVSGDIGSPTSGFRLSSNAVGTSTDPNIYGAYIKGAIIEGSYMKYNGNSLFLTAYNTLAPYVIFSSVNGYGGGLFYFDRLYSPTSGGSDIYRLSKYNQKVTVFGGFAGDFSDIYAAIQYKYDNETDWVTTFTRNINADYRAGVAFSSSFILKPTTYSYIDVRINIYGYLPEASSATLQVSNI